MKRKLIREMKKKYYKRRDTKRGLTLIELLITVIMCIILTGASMYIFRAVLLNWVGSEERTGVDISIDRGIEEAVRDLREARQISFINNDEIRFTQDLTNFYIYYLYNGSDTYPSMFNQNTYELRKAALSGGISGTFTYGSGQIIITEVVAPTTSDLSISSNLVTLDLSVRRRDEIIRSRTRVRPRNL